MSIRPRSFLDSVLEDYCFARGIPVEPARFTVTDAELIAWLNDPSVEDDTRLVLRDIARARAGDRDAIRLLEATGFDHLISEDA